MLYVFMKHNPDIPRVISPRKAPVLEAMDPEKTITALVALEGQMATPFDSLHCRDVTLSQFVGKSS